ncbi:hypothetical protein STANM309S_02125 [Streptomyces tanashiensis]
MTNKTRVRLVRVAASAVIIAGASLTAAGAAQAVGGFGKRSSNETQDAGLGVQDALEGEDTGNTSLGGISGGAAAAGEQTSVVLDDGRAVLVVLDHG